MTLILLSLYIVTSMNSGFLYGGFSNFYIRNGFLSERPKVGNEILFGCVRFCYILSIVAYNRIGH